MNEKEFQKLTTAMQSTQLVYLKINPICIFAESAKKETCYVIFTFNY